MRANGMSKPVSLTRFGTDMPNAMDEHGKSCEKKTKQDIRANSGRNPISILETNSTEATYVSR